MDVLHVVPVYRGRVDGEILNQAGTPEAVIKMVCVYKMVQACLHVSHNLNSFKRVKQGRGY